MSQSLSGAEFKKQLREGKPKMGLFINSHSPTVVEQLAFSGYDWLLVDSQHGPMGYETLSGMLAGIQMAARYLWYVSAGIPTGPASSRLWTWAPTEFFVPTSTLRTTSGNM